MEEDEENQQNALAEAAKQTAKNAEQMAKNEIKNAAKGAIKNAIFAIVKSHFLPIAGIALAIVVFLVSVIYITQSDRSKRGKEEYDDLTTQSGFFTLGSTIFGNGIYEYKLSSDDEKVVNKVIKALGYKKEAFSDFEKYVLKQFFNLREEEDVLKSDIDPQEYSEEALRLIAKFVQAEIENLYPDLGGDTNSISDTFQGNVKIKRNGIELKYKKLDEMQELIDSENYNALNFFSLDEDFNLIIVSKSSQYSYSSSNEGDSSTFLTKTSIPYMQAVSKYAVPFEFFNTLYILTEDIEFCEKVAQLAMDSSIVIEIYDETTTTTTNYTEEETDVVDYIYDYTIDYEYEDADGNLKNGTYEHYKDFKKENQKEQHTNTAYSTTTSSNPKIVITEANTMFWNMKQSYNLTNKAEPENILKNTYKDDTLQEEPIRKDSVEWEVSNELRKNAEEKIASTLPNGSTIKSTNFKQTLSTKDVYLKSRTVNATSTENINKSEYVENEANSILEFKDKGKGGFFDLFYDEESKMAIENIYDLQERLNEFFRGTMASAETYVSIFEYMKYLYSGSGTIVDISSILEDIKSGTVLTPLGGTSGFIVNTSMGQSNLVLDKATLQKAIKAWVGNYNTKRIDNLNSAIDALIQIQNQYNVNAVFAIAVLQQEHQCGTAWGSIPASTYNWASVKDGNGNWQKYNDFSDATLKFGSLISKNYFAAGLNSVDEIGAKYCPVSDGGASWPSSISSIMTSIYKAAGITISQEVAATGNGYTSQYTNKAGLTAKQYKQNRGSYSNKVMNTDTIAKSGCGYTSAAIVASMYGSNLDPHQMYQKGSITASLRSCGLKVQDIGSFNPNGQSAGKVLLNSNQQEQVLKHLASGNGAIIYKRKDMGGTNTSSQHYMAVLDVSDDKKMVYISNPYDGAGPNGWTDISTAFKGVTGAKLVTK